jgi:DNA-binding response OmpR family regulator
LSDRASARLLLVEDDAEILALEEKLLAAEGYAFDSVRTGEDALLALRARKYRVVVLDIGLPDMDGFSLGERLRRDPELGSPYVVFLTAKADLQSMHAGFSVGGVFYLTKPFTRARLLDVVKAVVEMG